MKLAEVVTLYEANASNITQMLRNAADSIEAETDEDSRTKAMVAVQVSEDGGIEVYGWGQTDAMQAIATLELGRWRLCRDHFGGEE